jgi:crotonobetainyl-CoA:carnitine CoA-transferase CaiB-like acyl-CoA transferase
MTGTTADPRPPLAGLRVVEFGQYIAVPAAGQLLRDLGAEVIKVEAAGGDPARHAGWTQDEFGPMFAAYNRGKRSVVLDLRSQEGRDRAFQLAIGADVVLQNARPGAMARAGIAPEQLRAACPRLIVATVTGYGVGSAFAGRSGLDIAAQAESGMMSINGPAGASPTRVGFAVVDVMTSQVLANAVLAALVRRGIHGEGASIDISLLDVATASMTYPWAEYALLDRIPIRSGNGQPTSAPAADVIATRDGAVVISAYEDAHFCRLAEAVGRDHLASDPRFLSNASRVAHRKPLLDALQEAFATFNTQDLCELLGKAGVVVAAVRNFDQVRTGANGLSPGLFLKVESPTKGTFELPGSPCRMDGQAAAPTSLPGIGEHTAQVLAELAAMSGTPLPRGNASSR